MNHNTQPLPARLTAILSAGLILFVFLAQGGVSPALAKAYLVDPNTVYVAPSADCGTAAPCYATLQEGIDAVPAGGTVKVAAGTYTAPGFEVAYINKALTMTGGYAITDWTKSDPVANPSIIDAQDYNGRRGMTIQGAAVIGTITIENLTFKDGHLIGTPGVDGGAGIRIDGGAVIVRGSQFISNYVFEGNGGHNTGWGGGIYVTAGTVGIERDIFTTGEAPGGGGVGIRGGVVTITHCDFTNNKAWWMGGAGIYMENGTLTVDSSTVRASSAERPVGINIVGGDATLTDNLIEGNTSGAYGSAGVSFAGTGTLVFTDNIVRNNTSNVFGGGGGLSINTKGPATVLNNVFEDNQASKGGALYISNTGAYTISNNTFRNNQTGDIGGAVYFDMAKNVTFDNNIVEGSTAVNKGGAFYLRGSTVSGKNNLLVGNSSSFEAVAVVTVAETTPPTPSTLNAKHWTLVNNGKYAILTDASPVTMTNTIVTGNTVAGLYGSGITADHTLFYNNGAACSGGAACTNNLTGDPKFYNPAAGDYRLGLGSAAIDAGIDAGVTVDYDGETRPMGSGFDIGFDEFPEPPQAGFTHTDQTWAGEPFTFTSVSERAATYAWDFGDGTTSTEKNPAHAYTAPGAYTVTLTVTNPAGSSTNTHDVAVLFQANFTSTSPDWLGQTTSFSNTTITEGETTYAWDFGDGVKSSETSPTHIYAEPGVYTVTLTATNASGHGVKTAAVTVFGAPQPSFTTSSPDWLGQDTTFTAALAPVPAADPSTSLSWDFGDTTSAEGGPVVTHRYAAPGDYAVTLTATNAAGSRSAKGTVHIDAPVVSFSAGSYTVNEGAGSIEIPVQLDQASEAEVRIHYTAAAGTALADDFTPTSGTLVIAPGQTSASFSVPVTDDTRAEPGRTVALALDTPENALPGQSMTAELLIVDNDPPAAYALNPASVPAGGPAFTLTVTGANFLDGISVVRWNGEDLPTTFVSTTQLTAQIAAERIAAVAPASITVVNPAPSGGASNALPLHIQAAPVQVCPDSSLATLQSPAGPVKVSLQGATTCATLSVTVDPASFITLPPSYTVLPNAFELTDSGSGFTHAIVEFPYGPVDPGVPESALRLLHQENGQWVDVTSGLNTAADTISGEVDSFSPFVIGYYRLAECAVSINNGAVFTSSLSVQVFSNTAAGEIMLSSDAGFNAATWQFYSAMTPWRMADPGNRIVTLVVYARLRQGETQLCSGLNLSDDIIYDPLAPTTSFTFIPTNQGAQRQASALTINVQAEDQTGGSGVAKMQISTNPNFSGAKWAPYTATAQISAAPGQTVYVRTRDGAGNVSAIAQRVVPDKYYYNVFLPGVRR